MRSYGRPNVIMRLCMCDWQLSVSNLEHDHCHLCHLVNVAVLYCSGAGRAAVIWYQIHFLHMSLGLYQIG